jgi:acetate kinase
MKKHVITLNAGSSSIKFSLWDAEAAPVMVAAGLVEMRGSERQIRVRDGAGTVIKEKSWSAPAGSALFHIDALHRVLAWRESAFPEAQVIAAGHRVVHGGIRYSAPMIVTDAILAELETFNPLAPLHQPHNLAGVVAAREAWPDVQQVACLDTAFHRTQPFVNDMYALPHHFYDEGVRRYGFHGLSYEYVSQRLREISPKHAAGRVVVAHLGNGASMCALRNGASQASTMGFSPLDGLAMGTRCGQIDPGVLLYLMQEKRMDAQAISDLLYKESGLKGVSSVSADMRELEASNQPEAAQAIAYFIHRIRREFGSLVAELEGLDAMVFCGGIGENARSVRARVLENLGWIGIELDEAANQANAPVISTSGSRVTVFVIPTDEEAMIVRHTLKAIDHPTAVAA